jgi:uncharacterized protein (TIGR00725 family)
VTGRRQVAVSGGGADPPQDALAAAEEVGRLLAEAEIRVVCGGLGGVMEAAARGAAAVGGEVLGILPGADPADANPYCTHVVATGIGHARNLAVVASADAVIAIGGEWGTLSEIGLAGVVGRPVVLLAGWRLEHAAQMPNGTAYAQTPAEAVELAVRLAPT